MKPPVRVFALSLLAAAAFAPTALAEEVLLRSGTRYDASRVDLVPGADPTDGSVRLTVSLGGGTATVLLPYDRLDPTSLLALVSARTDLSKGEGHLRLARLALARGLLAHAARSFRRAAEVDPALVAERDAGLRAVAEAEARIALSAAEADLARGRSDLALTRAKEIAAARPADDVIGKRARAIADLAATVVERDRLQREAAAAAQAKALADAAAKLLEGTLVRVDTTVQSGIAERDRVADPDLSVVAAQRALEGAESRFREGRRLLATLTHAPAAARPGIEARDQAVLELLVDTYLDLADLHRVRFRFDRARDYARAAGVLAPQDARVGEIRDRIDRDAATPLPEPYYDPYYVGPGLSVATLGGYGWRSYGGGRVVRPWPPAVARPRVPRVGGPGNLPIGW